MHVILCCTGLEEDEITGYSNGQCCFALFCVGLEEDKITWFSNSKKYSESCTVGLEDVKLQGSQTGFF